MDATQIEVVRQVRKSEKQQQTIKRRLQVVEVKKI